MKLTKKILFVLLFLFQVALLNAQVTEDDMANALNIKSLRHPYLYFTDAEKPSILESKKHDPESGDIMNRMLAECNRLLYTPVEKTPPRRNYNPRFYSDGLFDQYISTYTSNAHTLAFVYQMTGDEKYAQKAFEFIEAVCDLEKWSYREHEFNIIYGRVWPMFVEDDQVVFSFDHRTGQLGHEIATVYDWLYPALSKRQRDRIRGALLEKVILPLRGNYEYFWDANCYRCNHLSMCMPMLGVTALSLLTEDPQLVDVIAEAYIRTVRHLDEFGIDGGWQESVSYYYGAMYHNTFFMETLKRATKGKYNLFEHPRVKNNPATFLLYGPTASFGDGSAGIFGSTSFLNKMIEETNDPTAAYYRNTFFRAGRNEFDIIWPRSDVKPVEPRIKSKHFRSIDWVVMGSNFVNEPETVIVSCKAGMNDDPHHGHMDCGQFVLNWQGEAFIKDHGAAFPYDEKYFDKERFDYIHVSSIGHNVVLVNGETQLCAKYKDQPWQEGIGGKVLTFRTGENRDYTLMDPTNAYPQNELKGWRRHIILEKPVITVILDEIKSNKGAEIETRFHPGTDTDINENFVLLNGRDGEMALISVVDTNFDIRSGRHAFLPLKKDASLQWIPYFGTVVNANNEKTIIATIILPVEDNNDAQEIVNSVTRTMDSSGNLSLSFIKDGTSYKYNFNNTKEGLVLQN
ncbi:heparinase II/III family protein [Candidatus Latescibacterota bacterium]